MLSDRSDAFSSAVQSICGLNSVLSFVNLVNIVRKKIAYRICIQIPYPTDKIELIRLN